VLRWYNLLEGTSGRQVITGLILDDESVETVYQEKSKTDISRWYLVERNRKTP
jgi:hypothetical protein